MTSMRLPVDPGPAGWARVLPDADPAQPLEAKITADWLVIGAGFAGLAATRRLSQLHPEARIVTLDATRIGDGPAGRNSGFMIDLPHDLASEDYGGDPEADRHQIEDNRRAIAFAAEMAQEFDLPKEAFDPCGKVNGAATAKGDKHNRTYARHLGLLREDYQMLDRQDMADLTGITYYQSGLFTPGTVMLQPAMFVRGVGAGLRSNRVQIHENTPVLSLRQVGTDWCAQTPKGEVTSPKVILAVNGHLQSFGFFSDSLLHVHTYASMTRPLTENEISQLGGASTWNITPADPMGTTVRRISGTGGDRLVIRNRFTCDPDLEPAANWGQNAKRDHAAAFNARFTMLTDVDMEYCWAGRLCLSRNNVQVVSELQPGLFSACCQNGLGTAKGTLAGLLAAELASGIQSDALDRALASAAPKRLPPKLLTKLGANVRMRWGERRAGAEK